MRASDIDLPVKQKLEFIFSAQSTVLPLYNSLVEQYNNHIQIWMNIFYLFVLILLISLAYVCFIDDDCNSHGICNDGTCSCDIDWNVKQDCSGNIHYDTVTLCDTPIPHFWFLQKFT